MHCLCRRTYSNQTWFFVSLAVIIQFSSQMVNRNGGGDTAEGFGDADDEEVTLWVRVTVRVRVI